MLELCLRRPIFLCSFHWGYVDLLTGAQTIIYMRESEKDPTPTALSGFNILLVGVLSCRVHESIDLITVKVFSFGTLR